MIQLSSESLLLSVGLMLLVSAFFSGSETGLMAANRYRLHHLASQGHQGARRLLRLLERPDRLLAVILIGNTFANIAASAVTTVLGSRLYGEVGVVVAPIILTLVILIFAEIMPKTVASLYADSVAMAIGGFMAALLKLFYPLIWFISAVSNTGLRLLGIRVEKNALKPLTREELKGILRHSSDGALSDGHRQMLKGVLDLDHMSVDHVMIPRHQIPVIDLNQHWHDVLHQLRQVRRTHALCCRGDVDHVVGVISLAVIIDLLIAGSLNKATWMRSLQSVRYVPEGASLADQMGHFKRDRSHLALVVDEYGDIKGMITLDDILEEIVGHFLDTPSHAGTTVRCLPDGGYLVAGSYAVRDLNRAMGWELPTEGPHTLGGLLLERLEAIPQGKVSVRVDRYILEVVEIHHQTITRAKVTVDNDYDSEDTERH